MKNIPIALIYSRLLAGVAILLLSFRQPLHFRAIIIALIALGLISDILDGIIARRLGISSTFLRRLDSAIDQLFWLMILCGAYFMQPFFFKVHLWQLVTLISFETLAYLLSYIKFGKEISTHAIASKIWTLTIFITLAQIIATGQSKWLFDLCYYFGLLTRIEIILILLLLRQWTSDVPSVYHAVQLRRGKQIKRNKWFNG